MDGFREVDGVSTFTLREFVPGIFLQNRLWGPYFSAWPPLFSPPTKDIIFSLNKNK